MSELLEALLLGIVQGLTEFLPVSSSGHLEILKYILKDDSLSEESLMTSILLHFATALATVFVFRKEISTILLNMFRKESSEQKFVVQIIISMIPASLVGFFMEDIIDDLFHKAIVFVGFMLLVTGIILFLSERIEQSRKKMNNTRSFLIGIAQAVALLPGISRSGATIGTSLLLGIDKTVAARFSFLMVIPLIFGKIAKDLISGAILANMPSVEYLIVGFSSAFIVGVLACTWMIKIVQNARLSYFAYYCFAVFALIMIYFFLL